MIFVVAIGDLMAICQLVDKGFTIVHCIPVDTRHDPAADLAAFVDIRVTICVVSVGVRLSIRLRSCATAKEWYLG